MDESSDVYMPSSTHASSSSSSANVPGFDAAEEHVDDEDNS
jgi:hypothetical protein